jgi:hypothetical protein
MVAKDWASIEDFATLFQYLWYRDFPFSEQAKGAHRADWTKHTDKIVSRIADLMGLVTRFETGGKLDAILRSVDGDEVAIEWEWGRDWYKELNKLKTHKKMWPKSKKELKYAVLITYTDNIENSCKQAEEEWKDAQWPLLLILVKENKVPKKELPSRKKFEEIRMYRFEGNKPAELIRKAPALPKNVAGTRWAYELK